MDKFHYYSAPNGVRHYPLYSSGPNVTKPYTPRRNSPLLGLLPLPVVFFASLRQGGGHGQVEVRHAGASICLLLSIPAHYPETIPSSTGQCIYALLSIPIYQSPSIQRSNKSLPALAAGKGLRETSYLGRRAVLYNELTTYEFLKSGNTAKPPPSTAYGPGFGKKCVSDVPEGRMRLNPRVHGGLARSSTHGWSSPPYTTTSEVLTGN